MHQHGNENNGMHRSEIQAKINVLGVRTGLLIKEKKGTKRRGSKKRKRNTVAIKN